MASIIGALLFILATLSTTQATHIVGDMILTDDQFKHLPPSQTKIIKQAQGTMTKDDEEHERLKRNAIRDEEYRWPNGVIPYEYDRSFSRDEKRIVRQAMDVWSQYTCVSFRAARRSDRDKIFIQDGEGCSSNVGMVGDRQEVNLQKDGCRDVATVLHELGHSIGLYHTQSRPDRDQHLKIDLSGVEEKMHYNFEKKTWQHVHHYGVNYDYYSIMHYGSKDFGDESGNVIRTKNRKFQHIIGEAETLSFGDIEMVNKMYKCKPSSCNLQDSDCPGISFVGANCQCLCPGPDKNKLVQPCEGGNAGGSGNGNNVRTTARPAATTTHPPQTTAQEEWTATPTSYFVSTDEEVESTSTGYETTSRETFWTTYFK